MTSQELNKFIHQLFEGSGRAVGARKLTTHSFKATSLSWCAQHGVSGEHLAVLARHAGATQGATVLYSRDIISAAMRSFVEVLEAIRGQLFHPDRTRSGMLTPVPCTPAPATPLPPAKACDKSVDQSHDHEGLAGCEKGDLFGYSPGTPAEEVQVKREITWPEGELGNGVIDLDAPEPLTRPWDSDSDDESDESDSSSSGSEVLEIPESGKSDASASAPESEQWFINAKTLVIHCRRDANTFKCGRALGSSYFPVPALHGLRCGSCFAGLL